MSAPALAPARRAVSFFVAGVPAPKGSTRAFYVKALGRAVVTAANKNTRPWEQAVRAEAKLAGCTPTSAPVTVALIFCLARPKGHSGKKGLRPSAPAWPAKKPDIDKLVRAALDALTGEAWNDDAQVVELVASKRYVNPTNPDDRLGMVVTITEAR